MGVNKGDNRPIWIYRIEYERLPSMSTWTAFIAAHNPEEAEKFISTVIGPIRTLSMGMTCKLDSYSFQVRDRIVNAYIGKNENITVTEVTGKKKKKVDEKGELDKPVK